MRVLLVLLGLIGLACSARILAVLPFPAKSHSILQYAILRLLAQRGHEVVTYSPHPPPNTVANLTHIDLPTSVQDLMNTWTFEKFQEVTNDNNNQMRGISELATSICEDVLKNQNIRDLLESDQRFDLVFLEATLGQESLSVFSHKFKAPIINIQTVTTWSIVDFVAGNSLSISYIPKFLSLPLTNKMSFKERLQNLLSAVFTLIFYNYKHLPKQQRLVEQYYKDSSMPHVSEMLREIAITLINSQRTLEYPRPYTPNMIPIGGAHMSSHMTPLPQDIKTFVDTAKEGFIFFSLGTIVPAHIMPSKYMQAFVDAFQKLPQKVLWKIELESIPGLSENVMLTRWVPQPTVLNHPNCVLFLTHGGLFSQHEALYAGIPVLGVPFTDEQRYNLKFNEHLGVGMKLELADITEESVYKAIRSVIIDPRYKENAKRVSSIVRDQPMSPADTVVYWVEYVLRHGGASYLKPDSVNLRWFELLMLDVVLFILATIVVIVYCLYYISIPLYSCFCCIRRVLPEALSLYHISLFVLIIFLIIYSHVDKIFNLFIF